MNRVRQPHTLLVLGLGHECPEKNHPPGENRWVELEPFSDFVSPSKKDTMSPGRWLKLGSETGIPKVDFALIRGVNLCQHLVDEVLSR